MIKILSCTLAFTAIFVKKLARIQQFTLAIVLIGYRNPNLTTMLLLLGTYVEIFAHTVLHKLDKLARSLQNLNSIRKIKNLKH